MLEAHSANPHVADIVPSRSDESHFRITKGTASFAVDKSELSIVVDNIDVSFSYLGVHWWPYNLASILIS
jgi:hypothetical protein